MYYSLSIANWQTWRAFRIFTVGVGAFVIGLSQNSSFFSYLRRGGKVPSFDSFCLLKLDLYDKNNLQINLR